MIIYKILNIINGKCYIGKTEQSLEKRWARHLYLVKSGKNRYLYDAIRCYGVDNFKLEIIETCESRTQLDEREKFWISHFKTTEKQFGYNMNEGGTGGRHTQEVIDKIAEKRRGRKLTQEHKDKISRSHKGKIKTSEHLENISKGLTGIKRSDETKKKLREISKGRKSPMEGKFHSEKTRKQLSEFRKGKSLTELIGEDASMKMKESARIRFTENNPNFKEVDREELEKMLMQDFLLKDIAEYFGVAPTTIISKIKKYWYVIGVDEFRRKFLGINPTKNRKRGPYKKWKKLKDL